MTIFLLVRTSRYSDPLRKFNHPSTKCFLSCFTATNTIIQKALVGIPPTGCSNLSKLSEMTKNIASTFGLEGRDILE